MLKFSLLLANASDQYVSLSSGPFASGSFSLAFWVKLTTNGLRYAFSQGASGNDQLSVVISNSGHVNFFSNGGTLNVVGTAVVPLATWTHVCVTYNSGTSTATIYVNGTLDTSGTGTVGYTNSACRIGGPLGGTSSLDARLTDVRAYGSALPLALIQSLSQGHNSPGATHWWPFDEGTGTTTADAVGALTGTLTNGVTWSPDVPLAYDWSQLPSQKLRWRADSYQTFNHADWADSNQGTARYIGVAAPAAWAGVSKFTMCGFVLLNPTSTVNAGSSKTGAPMTICALQNPGGTQMCFSVYRNSNLQLQVRLAASLTDTGATWGLSSKLICGNNEQLGTNFGGQGWLPWAFVFDGTQPDNPSRLKIYIGGVRDTSVTYNGVIRTALTSPSSAATFSVGYGVFDGAVCYGGTGQYNIGVLAGYAASDAEIAALANIQPSGYPAPYNFSSLPAGSPATGSFTNFWTLGEASTGASPVTRVASAGALNLTDGLGAANVPAKAVATVNDISGNGFMGASTSHQGALSPTVAPQLVTNDMNGHPSVHFAPATSTNSNFRFGQLGFGVAGVGLNPISWTIGTVANYDFADVTHEMTMCGSDINNNGPSTQNATPDLIGEFDNDDASQHPAVINVPIGDGTNIDHGYTAHNALTPGTPQVLIYRVVPGVGGLNPGAGFGQPGKCLPQPWVNGVQQAIVGDLGTDPFWRPGGAAGTTYLQVQQQGGHFWEWAFGSIGNQDQSSTSPPAAWMGKAGEHFFCAVNVTDDQMVQESKRLGLYYGVALASTAPPAPSGVVASPISPNISLSWGAVTGSTAFGIYRGTSSGAETFLDLAYTNSYTDNDAALGTTYYYKVTAVISTTSGTLESVKSAEVSASWTAAAPASLTVTPASPNLHLAWGAVAGAATYNVYRGTTPGGETLLTSGVATNTYNDAATPATTYYYKVTAVFANLAGTYESAQSAEASGVLPPPAPAGLAAAASAGGISLTWGAAAGAATYNVYRGTSPGGEVLYVTGVATNSYFDAAALVAVPYFYTVTGVGAVGGEGAASNEVTATRPPTPLTDPARVWSLPGAGGAPGSLSLWVSASGDAAEDVYLAFDFTLASEALAGQTVTGGVVEYSAGQPGAPALALVGPPALAVGQLQMQVRVRPAPGCAGYRYNFSCAATFSGGDVRVCPGFLLVKGSATG